MSTTTQTQSKTSSLGDKLRPWYDGFSGAMELLLIEVGVFLIAAAISSESAFVYLFPLAAITLVALPEWSESKYEMVGDLAVVLGVVSAGALVWTNPTQATLVFAFGNLAGGVLFVLANRLDTTGESTEVTT